MSATLMIWLLLGGFIKSVYNETFSWDDSANLTFRLTWRLKPRMLQMLASEGDCKRISTIKAIKHFEVSKGRKIFPSYEGYKFQDSRGISLSLMSSCLWDRSDSIIDLITP